MNLSDVPVREGGRAAAAFLLAYLTLIGVAKYVRKSKGLQFGRATQLFALCAAGLVSMLLTPFESEWRDSLIKHLASATIIFGCVPGIAILNRLLWARASPGEKDRETPRLLADTTGLLVFLAVVLLVMQYFYGVRVPGLLAGSGVAAIILGLAMQDLLGNIFGGFSIFLDKPFKTGDWLNVEGTDAKVMEVTWRSTRLLTTDDVLIDVPNHHIVRQVITNFERPSPLHRMCAEISLHYDAPPRQVQSVLEAAAASVPEVLAHPKPTVFLKAYLDSGILYEIRVWINNHALANQVLSDVRATAWYAVRRAGLEIPYPQLTIHRPRTQSLGTEMADTASQSLAKHPIFGFLEAAQIERLVEKSAVQLFSRHESLTRQGDSGDSMFLLLKGSCEVRLDKGGVVSTVAHLQAGACIGEMSLLTGDPRSATVTAVEEVEALELTRRVFKPLVAEHPEILTRLSELLANRQSANQLSATPAAASHHQADSRASILRSLQKLFSLRD